MSFELTESADTICLAIEESLEGAEIRLRESRRCTWFERVPYCMGHVEREKQKPQSLLEARYMLEAEFLFRRP